MPETTNFQILALPKLPGASGLPVIDSQRYALRDRAGTVNSGNTNIATYPRDMADVNGDGRADIVGFSDDGVYTSLARADGTYAGPVRASDTFGLNGGWTNNNLYVRKLADVNGDGQADIVGFGGNGVYVALADGSGRFGEARKVMSGFGPGSTGGGWDSQTATPRELADVNGDGKADIVGFATNQVVVALGKSDGTFQDYYSASQNFGLSSGWANNDRNVRKLADVNGDGRADIVGFAGDGTYVALANSNGTFGAMYKALSAFGSEAAGDAWTTQTATPRELGDVNGDGRVDIVGFDSSGLAVALGKADGRFEALQFVPGLYTAAQGWTDNSLAPRRLADINGDKRADLVGFGSSEVVGMLSSDSSAYGNDTLDGGAGDDTLNGGGGDDRYHFNPGGGRDTIIDVGGNDRLVFGAGITTSQVRASFVDGQVTLSMAAGDSVSFSSSGNNNYAVEQFEFSDGSVQGAAWLNGLLNVAPTGANKTLTLKEDNGYTVTSIDLGFSDANIGDSLSAVRIDSLPATGSLKLGGANVAVAQVISAADLAAGRMVFSPATNANGNNYASLSFSVKDQYGAFDAAPNTLVFNVTPVNDAPTGAVGLLRAGVAITVASTVQQGDVLSINSTLADADGLGALSYQWQSSVDGNTWSAITGATAASFTLTPALAGQSVRAAASYTDGFGVKESVASAATTAVNRVVGTSGADTQAGTAGIDRLEGLAGDDSYTVNIAGDAVVENANEGSDTVTSSIDYTLTANVENLVLTGSAALNGTGTALNNAMTGNSGNNTLKGGAGDDRLDGSAGNDLLQGDEATGVGFSAKVTLSKLYTVNSGNINTTVHPREMADANGDGLADIVGFHDDGVYTSLARADGTYAGPVRASDTFGLNGGWTNNNLYVRKLADVNGDGKADIVGFGGSGVYVALADGSGRFGEARKVMSGFGPGSTGGGWDSQTATPRELADVNGDGKADIVGFAGGQVVVALGRADGAFQNYFSASQNFGASSGWTNNDRDVRKLADVNGDGRADIVGFAGDGTYVALANSNGTFGAMYKALSTFGSEAAGGAWATQTATPRELGDVNGDGRADIVGFDSSGLAVALGKADGRFEAPQFVPGLYTAAQGWTDNSLAPRRLADINGDKRADLVGFSSSEVVGMLSSSGSSSAYGNDTLYGGEGNDTLQGLAGSDVLDGQAGDDTLVGGSGSDIYYLGRGSGVDLVQENDVTPGTIDVLSFRAGITTNQLWFRHTGNDLEVSIIGTADKVTVQNWYFGNPYHVEQIKLSDGKVLLDTQVEKLVQAMAGIAPPAMGQTSLTAAQQTALAPVLAASWH